MIPNLPRELLWTDKKDISDFMSDRLGNDVITLFSFVKSRITISLGAETMLKLYNEAFFLSTRVVYEHDSKASPEAYMEKILADLGDKELAEHVLLLMFLVLTQQPDKSKEVLQFVGKLQKEYLPDMPFRIAKLYNKVFKPKKNRLDFSLKPNPYPADKLNDLHLDWEEITQGFSKQIINEILHLWESYEEKSKVINLIEHARKSRWSKTNNDDTAKKVVPYSARKTEEESLHLSPDEEEKKTLVLRRAGKSLDTKALKNTLETMLDVGDIPSGKRDGYVWYAVWLFLKKSNLLHDYSQSAFHRLMMSWFPGADYGNDDKMRRYNSEYLEKHNCQIWKYEEFKESAKPKTSERGFDAIKKLYEDLEHTIKITDIWKR